jgi:hypothetical protein
MAVWLLLHPSMPIWLVMVLLRLTTCIFWNVHIKPWTQVKRRTKRWTETEIYRHIRLCLNTVLIPNFNTLLSELSTYSSSFPTVFLDTKWDILFTCVTLVFPPYRSVHLLSTPVSLALVHSGPSPRVKQSVPYHHGGAAWNDIAGKRSEACEGSACPFGTCSVGALWEEFITKKCNSELQLGSLEKFLEASSSSSSD